MIDSLVLDRGYLTRWQAAGLDGPIVEILDRYHARAEALATVRDQELAAIKAAGNDRRRSLVAGAPAKRPADAPADPGRDYRIAHEAIRREALRELRGLGDSLIIDDLRPAHDALLSEARGLAVLVDGLRNDADAVRRSTSTEAREGWVRLGSLWDEREALLALVSELIGDKLVPLAARRPRDDDRSARWFRFPHRGAVMDPRAPQSPAARLMADLVLDEYGLEPGLFTADEVIANDERAVAMAAEERAQVEAASMSRTSAARMAADLRRGELMAAADEGRLIAPAQRERQQEQMNALIGSIPAPGESPRSRRKTPTAADTHPHLRSGAPLTPGDAA